MTIEYDYWNKLDINAGNIEENFDEEFENEFTVIIDNLSENEVKEFCNKFNVEHSEKEDQNRSLLKKINKQNKILIIIAKKFSSKLKKEMIEEFISISNVGIKLKENPLLNIINIYEINKDTLISLRLVNKWLRSRKRSNYTLESTDNIQFSKTFETHQDEVIQHLDKIHPKKYD